MNAFIVKRLAAGLVPACILLSALVLAPSNAAPTSADRLVPRFKHIFVIVEENKDYDQIVGSASAPNITKLAREYGNATQFFAETHPSEPNYVAMTGGYTYGIQDDDAYYCVPHDRRAFCSNSNRPGYVDHTIDAPTLATQLQAAGLTWKNYNESLPGAGSLAVAAGFYASKHSGFINFRSVQLDPHRADHLVGFRQLDADLKSGHLPNFALIVPNLCNEMHGVGGFGTPEGCSYLNLPKLVGRGDQEVGTLVAKLMASAAWRSPANAAIIITVDEDDRGSTQGCCGTNPADTANAGGGHIATVVLTNHGPRGVTDPTPYSHYSMLRSIEDAFGIYTYLRQAGAPGVRPMLRLLR